jgi:hypothetical protein
MPHGKARERPAVGRVCRLPSCQGAISRFASRGIIHALQTHSPSRYFAEFVACSRHRHRLRNRHAHGRHVGQSQLDDGYHHRAKTRRHQRNGCRRQRHARHDGFRRRDVPGCNGRRRRRGNVLARARHRNGNGHGNRPGFPGPISATNVPPRESSCGVSLSSVNSLSATGLDQFSRPACLATKPITRASGVTVISPGWSPMASASARSRERKRCSTISSSAWRANA